MKIQIPFELEFETVDGETTVTIKDFKNLGDIKYRLDKNPHIDDHEDEAIKIPAGIALAVGLLSILADFKGKPADIVKNRPDFVNEFPFEVLEDDNEFQT